MMIRGDCRWWTLSNTSTGTNTLPDGIRVVKGRINLHKNNEIRSEAVRR